MIPGWMLPKVHQMQILASEAPPFLLKLPLEDSGPADGGWRLGRGDGGLWNGLLRSTLEVFSAAYVDYTARCCRTEMDATGLYPAEGLAFTQ